MSNHLPKTSIWKHLGALLCVTVVASGCTGVPKTVPSPSPIAGKAAPQAAPVQEDALSVAPTPTPSNSIAQVGFRHRAHVGDDNWVGDSCGCASGPCANPGAACGNPMATACAPQPWQYDPQEYLCDGGDQPPSAVLTRDDRIRGLQPQDTVTHYTTEAGDIEFAASNRVCVYSPRFGNVRRITGAIQGDGAIAVSGTSRPVGPQGVDYDLPGLVMTDTVEVGQEEFTRRIDSMRDRNRGVRIESVQQPRQAADVRTVLAGIQNVGISELDESLLALIERYAVAATIWTLDESVEVAIEDLAPPVLTRDQRVDALVVYEFPGPGRLNLLKLADKKHAATGDTVTFALRLQNVGDSPVSGVVVTDNLVTRLEYVADSQTASVDAEFETKPNEANSSQLIWRLKEELAVGDSVTIEFECRVR
ncbi:DUF11 domain-containing protein [Allorhodopirellula solitaria]|nr:DUF11 domain-containing protein [Allorhodopirellula solitaria]